MFYFYFIFIELEEYQNMPKPAPYQAKSMSVQEQYRLQALIKKHGDDYSAMQRDLKLNIMQETAHKLQKRIELMYKLEMAGEEEDKEVELSLQESQQVKEIFGDLTAEEEAELLAAVENEMDDDDMDDEDDDEDEANDDDIISRHSFNSDNIKASSAPIDINLLFKSLMNKKPSVFRKSD